jgi:hypothetical protein
MTASRSLLHSLLLTLALAGTQFGLQDAQSPSAGTPLSVEEVVKLSQIGLAEELIITKIKKNGKAFDLSTDELLELKKAGVSDTVIKFLLDPSQPYTPPVPRPAAPASGPDLPSGVLKPSAPAKQYPNDAYASKVPSEPGLYRFPKDVPSKVDLKMLLGTKEGGFLVKKGKIIAYLVGPASKTRVPEGAPVFYMRLPEGKGIEEVVLVALERKGDRREIEMGPGPKEELKAGAMRQFDSLEVGPRLFKITTSKLVKGEYLFFQVGSAEAAKGNYGKGYDFGIEETQGGK